MEPQLRASLYTDTSVNEGFWAEWKLSLSLSAVYVEIQQGQVPGMPVIDSHEDQSIFRTRDATGVER